MSSWQVVGGATTVGGRDAGFKSQPADAIPDIHFAGGRVRADASLRVIVLRPSPSRFAASLR